MHGNSKVVVQIHLQCHLQVLLKRLKMWMQEKHIDKIIIETYLEQIKELHLERIVNKLMWAQLKEVLSGLKDRDHKEQLEILTIIKTVIRLITLALKTQMMNLLRRLEICWLLEVLEEWSGYKEYSKLWMIITLTPLIFKNSGRQLMILELE